MRDCDFFSLSYFMLFFLYGKTFYCLLIDKNKPPNNPDQFALQSINRHKKCLEMKCLLLTLFRKLARNDSTRNSAIYYCQNSLPGCVLCTMVAGGPLKTFFISFSSSLHFLERQMRKTELSSFSTRELSYSLLININASRSAGYFTVQGTPRAPF